MGYCFGNTCRAGPTRTWRVMEVTVDARSEIAASLRLPMLSYTQQELRTANVKCQTMGKNEIKLGLAPVNRSRGTHETQWYEDC